MSLFSQRLQTILRIILDTTRGIFPSATLPFILSQEEGGEVQNPQMRRVEAVEKVAVEFALFPLFAAVQEKKGQKQKGETFRVEAELAEPEARRLVVPGQRHAGQQQKQRIPGEKDEDLFFAAAVKQIEDADHGQNLNAALQPEGVAADRDRNNRKGGPRQEDQGTGAIEGDLPALFRAFRPLPDAHHAEADGQREENIVRDPILPEQQKGQVIAQLHQRGGDPQPGKILFPASRMEKALDHEEREKRRHKARDQVKPIREHAGHGQIQGVYRHEDGGEVFHLVDVQLLHSVLLTPADGFPPGKNFQHTTMPAAAFQAAPSVFISVSYSLSELPAGPL